MKWTNILSLAATLVLPAWAVADTPANSVRVVRTNHQAGVVDAADVFGNPFSDDLASVAGQPAAVPSPTPEAAPIYSVDSYSYPAPIAAAPSCGVTGPSCGVTGPSCGVTGPSCGVPSCGVPGCSDAGCGDYSSGGSCLSGCGLGDVLSGCALGGDCDLGDGFSLQQLLHGDCPSCVTVGGWFSAGYHTEGNDLFNSRPDEFALHQGWLYVERVADACESPFGFRVDVMYGIDADDTQAFGNPSGSWDYENGFDHGAYGWAIPQAYGEVAFGDWSVKVGHFYTLVGYEVVTAPDNFFYSHAMTMYNSEPFTHTGVLATRSMGDDVTLYAGWTLGWDTGFDQLNSGSSYLGGFSLGLSDDATLTYISTAGNFGWRGDDGYSHSILLDTTLTENLNYVLQSDLVRVQSTGEDNVGINQYFLYSVSDCLGLGARLEWWQGDVLTGYAPHGAVLPADGSLSYYAATLGVNVRPKANIVVRPEVRFDWSPAANYDETYFGVDAILTF